MIDLRRFIRLIFTLTLGILLLFLIDFTKLVIREGFFSFLDFAPNYEIHSKIDQGLISGKILAKEDYLGTIEARFNNLTNIQYGVMTLKISEPGSNVWYSENTYNTKVFDKLPLYPFGFPIINTSKNREFYFEFEIKDIELGKDIVLSTTKPNMVVKYDFPKSWVLGHPFLFIYYKASESYQSLVTQRFWLNPEFYFLIFILYLIITIDKTFVKIYKFLTTKLLASLILFLIIIEPFLLALGKITAAEKISAYIWLLISFYTLNYFIKLDYIFKNYDRLENEILIFLNIERAKFKGRCFS